MKTTRYDVIIPSENDRLAGWWYPGAGGTVVMAHGFGGTKDLGLAEFAESFQRAGMSVLVFDYRHFGTSSGKPRQLLSVQKQQHDYRSAVSWVRREQQKQKIGLWGVSFSGGHVLTLSACESGITCAVAMIPHTSGIASGLAAGVQSALKVIPLGIADRLLGNVTIPIVAEPGETGCLTSPGARAGYYSLIPEGVNFFNEVHARIVLEVPFFNPVDLGSQIRIPVLMQIAQNDNVTPPEPARKLAGSIPSCTLEEYPGGHFDIEKSDTEVFEKVLQSQTEFLKIHLA